MFSCDFYIVIPGRREAASFDAQLRIRESILTIVVMDSGPAPRGRIPE
jgi:hypothetical protein